MEARGNEGGQGFGKVFEVLGETRVASEPGECARHAIFYLLRTGWPWRYLPRDSFPPRSTVYNIFRKVPSHSVNSVNSVNGGGPREKVIAGGPKDAG
jgi:hypothetical protein